MKGLRALPLILVLVSISSSFAETQTFTDTVRVVMGSRESQDEVRVYATQEAKRRVLDKVGVYLSGSTEILRQVQESLTTSSFSDSTSVLQRLQTLAVGIVQTEVAGEEWRQEGGAFVLYLVCRVTVDPDEIKKNLDSLMAADRARQMVGNRIRRLADTRLLLALNVDGPSDQVANNILNNTISAELISCIGSIRLAGDIFPQVSELRDDNFGYGLSHSFRDSLKSVTDYLIHGSARTDLIHDQEAFYICSASGTLILEDTASGRAISIFALQGIRGFGATVKLARDDAIRKAGGKAGAEFLKVLNSQQP